MNSNGSEGMKRSLVTFVRDGSQVVTEENRVDRSVLTDIEWQQLLDWNATQQDYPQEHCTPQLVERQAQATPEALAFFMGGQSSWNWRR